jgi:hypothetical protein
LSSSGFSSSASSFSSFDLVGFISFDLLFAYFLFVFLPSKHKVKMRSAKYVQALNASIVCIPDNEEEEVQCREAMEGCPVEAIGDNGAG